MKLHEKRLEAGPAVWGRVRRDVPQETSRSLLLEALQEPEKKLAVG